MSSLRKSALLAWLAAALTVPCSAAPSFVSRTDDVLSFIGPTALAVDDFYGRDGVPDLVVTFGLGKRVVIFQNDGAGRFTAADVLAPPAPPDTSIASLVADKPTSVISADVNADGLPDIIGGNEGIQRFFGYSNPDLPGGWGAPLDTDAIRGNGQDLVLGDWNADGAGDLAFCYPGRVGIALGDRSGGIPTGTWSEIGLYTATGFTAGTQTDIEMGQFLQRPSDPAPVTDLLTVDYTASQIIVWPGNPSFDGTVFVDAVEVRRFLTQVGGVNVTPFEAVVRDWNADGNLDALVATTEGYLLYFAGVGGTAVFSAPVVTDLAGSLAVAGAPRPKTSWTAFMLADVTGDGIDDALIADAGSATAEQGFNWITVVRGVSAAPAPVFVDGLGVSDQWHYAASDMDRQRPGAIGAVDVDGDSDLDVVSLNADAISLTVWHNDGTGHLAGAPSYPAGGPLPRGIGAADLNGDGIAEVIVAISAPSDPAVRAPALLQQDGAGGLSAPQLLTGVSGGASGAHGTTLTSINTAEDQTIDLLVTYSSDSYLWEGNGNATFDPPVAMNLGPGEPRLGELAGGPAPDVAVGDRAGNRVVVFEGSGTGSFTSRQTIPGVYGYRDHVVASFTGSAKADIVVAGADVSNTSGLYVIPYDSASSTHLPPVFRSCTDLGITQPFVDLSRVAAGDFDGNGSLDLVALASSGEGFFFRFSGPVPQLDAGVLVSGGGSPSGTAVADITFDGIDDLVVAGANSVTVNEGASGAGFGAILTLLSNISNDSVAIGDVDGDTRPDLIAVSTRTADVTVFKNIGAAPLVLRVGGSGGDDTLSWLEQGAGASYSIARGDLALAWSGRNLAGATCLASGLTSPTYADASPLPGRQPPPSAFAEVSCWWYLVKCAGGDCQSPTFGNDSEGNARFGGAGPVDPCP